MGPGHLGGKGPGHWEEVPRSPLRLTFTEQVLSDCTAVLPYGGACGVWAKLWLLALCVVSKVIMLVAAEAWKVWR